VKKIILIDGYGLVFKGFYGAPDMCKKDGTPTGAVFNFVKSLRYIVSGLKFSHIVVAFDTGQKTFRHDKYKEYKANRPPCDARLVPQFPVIREVAEAFNMRGVEKNGYEADDVIATLTRRAIEENFDEIVIISSDKDLMQLVDDKHKVRIFDNFRSTYYDENAVCKKWGVKHPKQILDILSLMGDSSDNIPGVPGIGEVKSKRIINEFDSVENLVNNLDKIGGKKDKENISNNLDKLFLSRELVQLKNDVPLENQMDDFLYKYYDNRLLSDFLRKQEFYSLLGLI
jgi:DNA polymerase-1